MVTGNAGWVCSASRFMAWLMPFMKKASAASLLP